MTEEPQIKKPKAPAKRIPVEKKKRLFRRVLSYAWPRKYSIFIALVFSFLATFVGTGSLLPLIPAIQVVIDPESVSPEALQQRADEAAAEKAAANALPNAGGILNTIQDNVPFMESLSEFVDANKQALTEWVYRFLREEGTGAIKYIAALLIISVLLKTLLEYLSRYQINKIVFYGTQDMKVELYDACLNLDLTHLANRSSGNLMSRLNSDIGKVRIIIQSVLQESVFAPFEVVFVLAVLCYLSPEVTLITFVAMPIIVIPILFMSRKLRDMSRADAEEDAYLMDVMQETILGIHIVKAFNTEKYEKKRFRTIARAQLRRQLRRTRLSIAAPAITEVLTTIAVTAVVVAGVYVVTVEEGMTGVEFGAYLFMISRLMKPFKGITNVWMRLQRGFASAERVFEIIDTKPIVAEAPNPIRLLPIENEITFSNAFFRYSDDRDWVLRGLDLSIPKGKVYAIVGETGSGKTTISRLIPRFYDPNEGSILIDGINLRDVSLSSLREQIAIVTQDTILFDSTLFDNIAYGRRSATKEEVEDAAKAANAHNFIMQLPDGYETKIGERGGKLSGGQRQRIAIARAVLKNSPILILDEATSALDNESQALVQDALNRLMEDRTVIIIAHRLSTIRNADCVVVLSEGKVLEKGSHQELLALPNSYYARLYSKERIDELYAENNKESNEKA
ncbi:MAG: ABC transporter ATP-binding protein [Sumerlaeia bacterium]